MAVTYKASTLVVTGTGDQSVPGPIDLIGAVVPEAGTLVVSKGGTEIMTLEAGTHHFDLRSASGLTVNGACTLLLRLRRHD
jgi:hypothetical protein